MASSVSGQDESNPALWLATRAGKRELSCPLRTSRHVPQEKFSRKPYDKPLLTKLVRSRWLDIGLVLILRVYGPRLRLGPWTRKKELGQYPAILTEQAWSITHTSLPTVLFQCFSQPINDDFLYFARWMMQQSRNEVFLNARMSLADQ